MTPPVTPPEQSAAADAIDADVAPATSAAGQQPELTTDADAQDEDSLVDPANS